MQYGFDEYFYFFSDLLYELHAKNNLLGLKAMSYA